MPAKRRAAPKKRKPATGRRRAPARRRQPARQGWLSKLLPSRQPPLQTLGIHRFSYEDELSSAERLQNRIDANKWRQSVRQTAAPYQTVLDTLGQADPRMRITSTSIKYPSWMTGSARK